MTTTRIKGGLGNQLFQFYAGLYLARLSSSTPLFYFNTDAKGAFQHGDSLLDLDFGIELNRVLKLKQTKLNSKLSRFLSLNHQSIYNHTSKIWKTYQSSETGYDPQLQTLKGDLVLEGYFQTYKYFEYLKSKSFITGLFRPVVLSPSASQLQVELLKENPIIMHVRRGDYVANQHTGLLSRGYYSEALGKVGSGNRTVWVFSDDVDFAQKDFSEREKEQWRWIGPNQLNRASDSLYLMSLAKDIVIGNSTFSYWAAILNEQKTVIAPGKWHQNQKNPKDLYPDSWQIVTSTWVDQ